MGYYFDDRDGAAALYGAAPENVIRLLAARYMGDNPPAPFVWRVWNENGIRCDSRGRYLFDFGARFPDAENGSTAYACGDLYCAAARPSRFTVSCTCPCILRLNGEEVFRSAGEQERSGAPVTFPVSLRAGYNRFLIRCERTAIGFDASLQNAMPQWEPCSYIMPFSDRNGEAGFLYTAPMDVSVGPGEGVWGDTEAASGVPWLPEAETRPLRESGSFYAWTAWEAGPGQETDSAPDGAVLLDGMPAEQGLPLTPGRHEALLYGPLASLRAAAARLSGASAPIPVRGPGTRMLVLGPCAPSPSPSSLLRAGAVYGGTVWRPDAEGMYLRPYAEAALFGRWTYPLGVTNYGLLSAGRLLREPFYVDYVRRHVRQVTEIEEYALWDKARWGFSGVNQQLNWLDSLDDCGSFASLMLECDPEGELPGVSAIAERVGRYMLEEQPRTPDGAFRRRDDTVWADDLYMSGPFLCRYARLTGRQAPLDECAAQQLKYRERLFLPEKQIMAHMMCLRHGKNNGIPWSRGNGWVIFSLSELLCCLDGAHPSRGALLAHFNELTEGFLRLQDENGLWHQLLDDPDSYPETSATAMFICAFCRGVRGGWYPTALAERAKKAAALAWRGLAARAVDRGGNLYGVCRGSGFSFSRAYYRSLMWNRNDTHGVGIVMLAGVEIMKTGL